MFSRPELSHAHSLPVLNALYEYDDFMSSIQTVADIGCGQGLDLEWWATRTTRDEKPEPLNIQCTGIDTIDQVPVVKKYKNTVYQKIDFEQGLGPPKKTKFDVLWCHDAFQYAINPIKTLSQWRADASENAMLVLIVPQTTNITGKSINFYQPSGCYYHYTMINLIHMLAIAGWDCRGGYFKKSVDDPWLYAAVYNSAIPPMNPKNTTWYDLVDKKLLPESADRSIMAHGYLNHNDLVLSWIDKSITWLGQQ
jgi:SAM-dependent methyltransferase